MSSHEQLQFAHEVRKVVGDLEDAFETRSYFTSKDYQRAISALVALKDKEVVGVLEKVLSLPDFTIGNTELTEMPWRREVRKLIEQYKGAKDGE